MKPESVFYRGGEDRPLVIFVSGMGMDISIWSEPERTRVLGGAYPLTSLLKDVGPDVRTTFMDLHDRGFPVLAWNQRRPAGPIAIAVAELRGLVQEYREHAGEGIILIGHSRGGLIARKYLEEKNPLVRCVITLAAPHSGTTMAKWASFLSPLASSLDKMLKGALKEDLNSAFRKVLRFFSGKGLKELLPESDFFKNIKDIRQEWTRYVSFGGTDPDLMRVGSVFLSDVLSRVIPAGFIPDELKDGYGDGMVSAASAVIPYAAQHYDFHVNHASILFHREVRELAAGVAEAL